MLFVLHEITHLVDLTAIYCELYKLCTHNVFYVYSDNLYATLQLFIPYAFYDFIVIGLHYRYCVESHKMHVYWMLPPPPSITRSHHM